MQSKILGPTILDPNNLDPKIMDPKIPGGTASQRATA